MFRYVDVRSVDDRGYLLFDVLWIECRYGLFDEAFVCHAQIVGVVPHLRYPTGGNPKVLCYLFTAVAGGAQGDLNNTCLGH